MNNSQKNDKTIDLNDTKRQRSSKNINHTYTNPYSRETNDYTTKTYDNKYYDNSRQYNYNKEYITEISSKFRKKELKERQRPSKNQLLRNKKKRKIKFIMKIIIRMTFTVIIVWGGINIKDMLAYPKVSYQVVRSGSIDNSKAFEGIIVRDEKVYYSQNDGMMQTIIGEGEKVKKNGEVCALIDNNVLAQTEQEKDKISTELYNLADKRKQLSYYQDDIYQIDTSIRDTLNIFYGERLKDSTDYIYAIRTQLDSDVNKRTILYMKEQNNLDDSATQKLTLLDHKIGNLKYVSKPEESGIVSYTIDGQEVKLSNKAIDTMSYNMFKEAREKEYQNVGNNTHITKGMPLYKIISEDVWHIISYIDTKEGTSFKQDEIYTLTFDTVNNIKINFILKNKITEGNRIKLVFETNDQIDHFLGQRSIAFSIGNKNEEGLKIPLTAIVEQNMIKIPSQYKVERNGEIGVYRKKGEITEFVKISPQYEETNTAYILQEIGKTECIQINDVLSDPSTGKIIKIEGIQTKQGVYVINGKLAQFKAIDIYIQTNEYALIKYTSHNELKELDKIISNPKSIKRDQLLQHMNIQNE